MWYPPLRAALTQWADLIWTFEQASAGIDDEVVALAVSPGLGDAYAHAGDWLTFCLSRHHSNCGCPIPFPILERVGDATLTTCQYLSLISQRWSKSDPDQQSFRRQKTADRLPPWFFLVLDEHLIASRFQLGGCLLYTIDVKLKPALWRGHLVRPGIFAKARSRRL